MRRGLGHGMGKGYKNLVPGYDRYVHQLSAKGINAVSRKVRVKDPRLLQGEDELMRTSDRTLIFVFNLDKRTHGDYKGWEVLDTKSDLDRDFRNREKAESFAKSLSATGKVRSFLTRKDVELAKWQFNRKGQEDEEFLRWYRRNLGSGSEDQFVIIEDEGMNKVVDLDAKSAKYKKSKDVFPLPIETAIIVPSTDDVEEPITAEEFDRRVSETRKFLSDKFGGYTSLTGFGGYTTKKGEFLQEPASMVISYADRNSYFKNKDKLLKFAKNKRKEWGQESIGVEVEGDLFLVS